MGKTMPIGYFQEKIVLITDPSILAIPIFDNGEPLVDLRHQAKIAYGPSPEIPNNMDYTKIRQTVYEKLKQAQGLLPKGMQFCLYEGYRSLSLQRILFDNRFEKIHALYPNWTQEEVFQETTKLVSPVINQDGTKNIPAHSTGGAIDVYLINDAGEPIEMGIHPQDWMQDTDGSLSLINSQSVSGEAQRHRQIMSNVLMSAGFTNYPTEYWHWSYGDRYWAYHQGRSAAIYGAI
jgi:D-alanyl-D-alanine dipeptidase